MIADLSIHTEWHLGFKRPADTGRTVELRTRQEFIDLWYDLEDLIEAWALMFADDAEWIQADSGDAYFVIPGVSNEGDLIELVIWLTIGVDG